MMSFITLPLKYGHNLIRPVKRQVKIAYTLVVKFSFAQHKVLDYNKATQTQVQCNCQFIKYFVTFQRQSISTY